MIRLSIPIKEETVRMLKCGDVVCARGVIYTPSKPGEIIGTAGPTTSYRMYDLTIHLLERGLRVMIGKGKRDAKVINAMKKQGVVYLADIDSFGNNIYETGRLKYVK